jgi:hypothetical protein
MSDRPDRERLEPELGQDLLDILPDRGIGRAERESLAPRPLPKKKRRGFLLWFVIFFLASGGAVATWWWASKESKTVSASAEVPTIKADDRSYKSKPSQPGGMDVPDQDKMIYDRMGGSQDGSKQVERLLPPPEAPQAPPQASQPVAPAYVAPVAPVAPPVTQAPAAAVPPPQLAELPKGPVTESPKATPPSMKDNLPPEPAPVEPPSLGDKMAAKPPKAAEPPRIATEPTQPPMPAKKDAKKKVAEAPAASKITSSASGAWLVQLGAITEEANARKEWGRIQKANGDLLGSLELDVQRAELPKGVFFRLRGAALDSKESAKALCQQLVARKQDCIVVHK